MKIETLWGELLQSIPRAHIGRPSENPYEELPVVDDWERTCDTVEDWEEIR